MLGNNFQDRWMTTEDLCDYISVSQDWVYDRVSKNQIPHVKIGRRLKFKLSEIDEWVEAHRD